MLLAMAGVSLAGVLASLSLHGASYFFPINNNVVQLPISLLSLILCVAAANCVPRSHTASDDSGFSVKMSILKHVPLWLSVPIAILGVYSAFGFMTQVPGVHKFSVMDMSPTLARWACILYAVFYQVAAVIFVGAARLRRLPA